MIDLVARVCYDLGKVKRQTLGGKTCIKIVSEKSAV